jgi:hypothetical protein
LGLCATQWDDPENGLLLFKATNSLNGRFLATSHVFQAMVGHTEEELRTVNFLDSTHEDYREANWALITELVERKRRQFQIDNNRRPASICQESGAKRFWYSRGGMPKLLNESQSHLLFAAEATISGNCFDTG